MDVGPGGAGVARYTLFDEDIDTDRELAGLNVTCEVKWNSQFAERTGAKSEVLVAGFGDQAVPFLLQRLVTSSGSRYMKVASITVKVPGALSDPFKKVPASFMSECDVYCLREDVDCGASEKAEDGSAMKARVCIVVCGLELGPHAAVAFGDVLTSTFTADRLIVLESGKHLELLDVTVAMSNQVRCIMTSEARKGLGGRPTPCPILAAPNMITGAAAQVMANCQYAGVPATCYVAYRDAHDIDVASLRAFEVAVTTDDRLRDLHAEDPNCQDRFAVAVAQALRFSTPQTLYA